MSEIREVQDRLWGNSAGNDPLKPDENTAMEWAEARNVDIIEMSDVVEEELRSALGLVFQGVTPKIGLKAFGAAMFQIGFETANDRYAAKRPE
jgi:hypothetical protein